MQAAKNSSFPAQPVWRAKKPLWPAVLAAFALPIFTWYAWYPLAGYSEWTVRAAVFLNLAAGAVLLVAYRFPVKAVGLGLAHLGQAVFRLGLVYGLILLLGIAANGLFEAGLPLLRNSYRLDGFLEGWLLTGLGEELLFAGVLFSLVAGRLSSRKGWAAVLVVALLFALWHLPGYLAQGRTGMDLAGRLAINLASWGFFGAVYVLSGNLWLAAFTHGSTDYALTPMIVDNPLVGLLFMGMLMWLSWIASSGRFPNWLRRFNKNTFNHTLLVL